MMSTVFTLLLNDLAVAFKNKTVFLLVFIPALICLSLRLADDASGTLPKSKIGLVRGQSYPDKMVAGIDAAKDLFVYSWVDQLEDAKLGLKEKRFDAVLIQSKTHPQGLELVVYRKQSLRTIALVENLAALQRVVEGKPDHWVTDIASLGADGIQKESLSTWVLTILLLVGFIAMPAQVAEEKEKKLLLGLLQTPMTEGQWLLSKLLMGVVLALSSTMLLHIFSGIYTLNWPSYLTFILVGSLYFSSVGILLGFLCRTQASARALGVIFYLPHLLPSALSDFSTKMSTVARFIPSYQFNEPIKSILLEGGQASQFPAELLYLFIATFIACIASYALIRKRWLMG